jgi:CRP/FNR family cyclic AMP-dependent transcriptional regulator
VENQVDDKTSETLSLGRFVKTYQKSEVVFEEGTTGNEMYLIHSGKVKLSMKKDGAKERPIAVLNPGAFFGEMALMDNQKRSATAIALEDNTKLIVLDKAKFIFIVLQQPTFALSLMHTLCKRLRELNKRLSSEGGKE